VSESPAATDIEHKVRSRLVRALFAYLEQMGPVKTRAVLTGWASAIGIMDGVLIAREPEE